MPKASFNHARHGATDADCKGCHDVVRSHKSSDIAMPDIENCRKCHGGNQPSANRLVSPCITCHDFHQGRVRTTMRPVQATTGTK